MIVPKIRPTIVVAMHDGFFSCGTGAGRSNRAFLEVLIGLLNPRVHLVLLPIHLKPASPEYNHNWHASMHVLIQRTGGDVIPIDNGTAGYVRFGGLDSFRTACAHAADAINRHVLPTAGPLLIIASDSPFYGLAPLLASLAREHLVVVARSTAALHAPDDRARIVWEHDGLHAAVAAGGRIAAISTHMRDHLAADYQIPQHALLTLLNGATTADWRHIDPPDTTLLPSPAQSGFLLAMGRAQPYKGFDDLLDALALLKAERVNAPHTLLAAVTDGPRLSLYQQHLAARVAGERLDATLLTRFAPGLRSLLIHPALAAVIVPSRVEPFGRIPLEAFIAGASPVVATTAGGLAELVTDGQTGYIATPNNPASLAAAIRRALTTGPAERARFRAAGRRLAASRYNHERSVRSFLHDIARWAVDGPAEKIK